MTIAAVLRVAVVVGVILAAAGCGGATKTVTEPAPNASEDGSTGTSGQASGPTSAGQAPNDAAGDPGEPATGARVPLKLQARHPNGTALRLTDVTFNETSISIGFKVTNGNEDEIYLNNFGNSLVMEDDIGNSYKFSAPTDNEDVTVKANGALRGTFIFQPEVDPGAKTLKLVTNSKVGSVDNADRHDPKLTIDDIPVGG